MAEYRKIKRSFYIFLIIVLIVVCFLILAAKSVRRYNQMYYKLQEQLERYDRIRKNGGWPQLSKSEVTSKKPEALRMLRKRLFLENYLKGYNELSSDSIDPELESAIKEFQLRHGLILSGCADAPTIRELNVPVNRRITQIRLNIWRAMQLPDTFSKRYIIINIPTFRLYLCEKDSTIMSMKVIVGRLTRKTPVFRGEISSVEINPYWTIPPGIMAKDIVPLLKKNPFWLEKNHMHVYYQGKGVSYDSVRKYGLNYKYQLVQDPGPDNPLGKIRFNFPNKYFIYLHDTPHRELFESPVPAFSSGCIRLENIEALFRYVLLNDLAMGRQQLDSLLAGTGNVKIEIKNKIKIYITYFTCWTDNNDHICFGKDVYHQDMMPGKM